MIWLFAALSFLGFSDAFFLTVKHFYGEVPGCSFLEGCGTVLQSQYSEIFGIPLAAFGAAYYLCLLILILLYLDRRSKLALAIACKLTWVGLGVSVWLVYLMVFVLKALCLYCLVSAASSGSLFLLARIIEHKTDKTHS